MTTKSKVPKRLAGVKIPKALRRGLRDLARSPSGKAVLTEALVAAGGALAAIEARPGSRSRTAVAEKGPQAKTDTKTKKPAAEAMSSAGLGVAFEDAARAFAESLKRRAAPAETVTIQEPPGAPH